MAHVALQLYSVREDAQNDFLGLLKKVADIGYDGVEFAGYFETPAETLRQALDDLGLVAAGTHIGVEALRHELDDAIAYCQKIACPTITCPGFWGVDLKAERTFREMGRLFQQVGERCRSQGIHFSYHIHGHEFEVFNGQYGLDILLQETTPDTMTLQPDIGWLEDAGLDALDALKTYGSRCTSLHVRDLLSKDGHDGTEVGAGILDIPAILAEARALSIEWLIVEQEAFTRPPLESVAISLKTIRDVLQA